MSEQNSDQFSLVSLEKGSQKAASSYANMSKRARGEPDTTLSINEEEAQNAPAPAPAKKKKPPSGKSGGGSKKKNKPAPPPMPGDRAEQSIDDMIARFEEFTETMQMLLANAGQVARNLGILILTPLIPLLNKLLKLLDVPLQFINILTRKVNEKMGRPSKAKPVQNSSAEGAEVEDEEDELESAAESGGAEASEASFSEMLELNIIFMDNMKKPLYKKSQNNMKLSAMEEELIMSNAILAIQECAEFTLELPNPTEGMYAGQRIYDIMSNANNEDVGVFLGFVKAYPGKYIGKEWKISETFATWLINNAPTSE